MPGILHSSLRIGRQVEPPGPLRAALEQVLGEPVGHVRVIERSLYARLHRGALATTRPRRIYLRGAACEFFDDPWLMLHEYCHVLRQWEPGELTLARYVLEGLRHGYWNNRFEVEARAFADRLAPKLWRLLHHPSSASLR
jgi:hypothetical protein